MLKTLLSMFNISLPVANVIFGLANIALILGAVMVAVGTIAAIWSGGIRERFADERTSINEAQTSTAIADAARANEATEKLRESNLTLQVKADHERAERLKLEIKFAPRRLSGQQEAMLIDALKPFRGQMVSVFCLHGDHESLDFVKDFIKTFSAAGWTHNGTGINQIEVSNMTIPQGEFVLPTNS